MTASGRHRLIVVAALTMLCLVWGSTWLGIKIQIRDQPPLGAAAVRFLLAAAIIAMTAGRRRLPRAERPSFLYWTGLGIVMIGVPYGCVYWGEQYLPSGVTAVLFATYPLFVALMAHRSIDGERLHMALLGGVACGISGVAVLFSSDLAGLDARFIPASLLILVSAASSALSSVMIKRRLAHMDPLLVNLRPMLIGGLMLLVASALFEREQAWHWTGPGLLALVYLAVFGSLLTFGSYIWLMRTLPVSSLSFVTYVTPVVALALGSWFANEALTREVLLGTALVLTAVLLARRTSRRMARRDTTRSDLDSEAATG